MKRKLRSKARSAMIKKGENFGAPVKLGPFSPSLRCQLATAFQNCPFCAE